MAGLTAGSLFASMLVSGVGLVLTGYGKKLARPPQLVAGLVMMIYPYFVPRVAPMLIVAGALLAAMWLAIRRGY